MKRFLIAAAIGALVALALSTRARRQEWTGLSESEARTKLDQKLPSRIPEERRAAMADRIIDTMRDRGVIVADEPAGEVDLDLTEQPAAAEQAEEEAPAATS